jgi:hypothetical protein
MLISHLPEYQSARASVYYWQKQIEGGRSDEASKARLQHWKGIIAEFRSKKSRQRGRMLGAIGKRNPLYVPPVPKPRKTIRSAKMPKIAKEVVQKAREEWVPVPLSWD